MATFRIKNYKGNLLESVKNFQKKYPSRRITEAVEEEDSLKITTEDMSDKDHFSYDEFLGAIDNDDVWENDYGEEKYSELVGELKDYLKRFCVDNDLAAERYDDLLRKLAEYSLIAMWNGSFDIFES